MKNLYHDLEIKFLTRGDDIEMLKKALSLVPHDNELLAGYLCYLKNTILNQLDMQDIEFPKEEYPLGHKKGLTEQEFFDSI